MSARREAHTFLASLKVGEPVLIHRDGRTNEVTVQRELTPGDGGGFGSWDHSRVTVGYGPGRWNTEVTPAAIEAGFVALERDDRDRSIPSDTNFWGTKKSDVCAEEYCVECERMLPLHYETCPLKGQ
jgi:hypothetical protein